MPDLENFTHPERVRALIAHLSIVDDEIDDITEMDFNACAFDAEGGEYEVLTDDEADEKAREYIKDSLWAFNSEFVANYCTVPAQYLRKMQEDMCEDCNGIIAELIRDLDEFIDDAISTDGRGHFLSTYDGEEHEATDPISGADFIVIRTN